MSGAAPPLSCFLVKSLFSCYREAFSAMTGAVCGRNLEIFAHISDGAQVKAWRCQGAPRP